MDVYKCLHMDVYKCLHMGMFANVYFSNVYRCFRYNKVSQWYQNCSGLFRHIPTFKRHQRTNCFFQTCFPPGQTHWCHGLTLWSWSDTVIIHKLKITEVHEQLDTERLQCLKLHVVQICPYDRSHLLPPCQFSQWLYSKSLSAVAMLPNQQQRPALCSCDSSALLHWLVRSPCEMFAPTENCFWLSYPVISRTFFNNFAQDCSKNPSFLSSNGL